MDRVAIIGMGLVDTLGNNPDLCLANYLMKKHEPDGCFYSNYDLLQPENIRAPIYASLVKSNKMALHTVEQALINVPHSSNVAVVYSSVTNCTEVRANNARKIDEGKKIKPREAAQLPDDFVAGLISREYDFYGVSTGLSAACATSLYNIDYAVRLIDEYDYVVVGASDAATSKYDLSYYDQLGALGTHSAPFDKNRDGFIMGEGAGCLVLQREELARKNDQRIYGYVNNVGLSNDASHGNAVAPDLDGRGIKRAMNSALCGDVSGISFVSAHATSTPLGDIIEYNAIRDVIPNAKVVGLKSKLGHCMGASGIVELIYTLGCLNNNVIPYNHNINDCDVDVPTEVGVGEHRYALKNSMGFGGKNASILVEGYRG